MQTLIVIGSHYFYPSAHKKWFQRVIKFVSSQVKISLVTAEHCLLALLETNKDTAEKKNHYIQILKQERGVKRKKAPH